MKITDDVIRVDGSEKIRGENKYLEDILIENLHFARTIRSPIPRGKLIEMVYPDGFEDVYIVDWTDTLVCNGVKMIDDAMPIFAEQSLNYLGEPIALIVSKDKNKIIDFIEKTEIVTETLDGIYSLEDARKKTIVIHNEDNLFSDLKYSMGDTSKLENTHQIFDGVYNTSYQEQMYLEKQGVCAYYRDDRVHLLGSMQCPYYIKNALTYATGFDEDRIRVVQTDTGGAFGGKEEYPSLLACQVALATIKLGVPVQMIFDRREDVRYTTKRHPSEVKIRSFVKNKKVEGMEIDVDFDAGPYAGLSDVVLQRGILTLTGAYMIPNVKVNGKAYATNNVFTGAFRGFGAPQTIFALEQHMSMIARELDIDQIEFKSSHFIKQGDLTSTSGVLPDVVKLPEIVERLNELSEYSVKMKKYKKIRKHNNEKCNIVRGLGVSFVPHGGGFTGDAEASHINAVVKLIKEPDGLVQVRVSNVDMGQGARTVLTKIVAATLDVPFNQVNMDNPDTDLVPDSGPTVASRTTMVVGNLLHKAALNLKGQMACPNQIIETASYKHPDYIEWDQEKLRGNAYLSYSWSGNVAEVAIDLDTYELTVEKLYGIYDVGRVMDEKLAIGQVHGGMIQGMGYAIMENMFSEDGKIIQDNMEAYPIPTTMDIPEMYHGFVTNEYEDGPFGAKGIGELTLVGMAPAIASAVEDAIGKSITRIPITPEYIMEVMDDE